MRSGTSFGVNRLWSYLNRPRAVERNKPGTGDSNPDVPGIFAQTGLIDAPELGQQVLWVNRLGQDFEIVSLSMGLFQKVSRGGLS